MFLSLSLSLSLFVTGVRISPSVFNFDVVVSCAFTALLYVCAVIFLRFIEYPLNSYLSINSTTKVTVHRFLMLPIEHIVSVSYVLIHLVEFIFLSFFFCHITFSAWSKHFSVVLCFSFFSSMSMTNEFFLLDRWLVNQKRETERSPKISIERWFMFCFVFLFLKI